MIPYSVNVAALIAACWVFYKVLLHKETYYRLNRQLLMGCIALAFVLPLIPVPQKFSLRESVPAETAAIIEIAPAQTGSASAIISAQVVQPTQNSAVKTATNPLNMYDVIKWLTWIYWGGVAVFGANFLLQIAVLLYQAYRKPVIRDGKYRIVEFDDDKAPCRFGNNIFINPTKYDWDTYEQILQHEKVHIQQGHSVDLIIAELMLVMQWFNPFAWLYRREVESNLEFLTDDAMIRSHKVDAEVYQLSLLKVSVPNLSMRVTTNYNQSLLKTRIIMMNTKRSNIHAGWKYFTLIPLLALLVCGLNKPVAISSPLVTVIKQKPSVSDTLRKIKPATPMPTLRKLKAVGNVQPVIAKEPPIDPKIDSMFAQVDKHTSYLKKVFTSPRIGTNAIDIDFQLVEQQLTVADLRYSASVQKHIDSVHTEFEKYPLFKREYVLFTEGLTKMGAYMATPEFAQKLKDMSPEKREKFEAYMKSLEYHFK